MTSVGEPLRPRRGGGHGPAVVALGGGHGLSATLSALRHLTDAITAVVTVADDGGSSGRLRDELDVLPPGDLRMAMAALCDDSGPGRTWRTLLQHRFSSLGPLDQHALGNLLIAGVWEIVDDPVAGLDLLGGLLGARGRVLPMCPVPLQIEADVRRPDGGLEIVVGQSSVARTADPIERVRLLPAAPPACDQAVAAVRAADVVVLGPGSWYTSVLPHLLVPDLALALQTTTARSIVVLNIEPEEAGETAGMRAYEHLEVLREHAPALFVEAVVADPSSVDDIVRLDELASSMGARLLVRQVRRGDGSARHDPLRLAAALRDVTEGVFGDVDVHITAASGGPARAVPE
ncbi:MAG: uridine diphosphate-N-acetylglucosamine-binding protein YvcK [Actinobacteria bacterium]|nr:uridine diphosphate-N-acetylglucosamine-binding protein YvcK [Actinomycetota bacterium]MCG2801087.1 uridine diphosphate-N-acetylglucosamine-binding protein YvcK [Cellulomonas sp.]